MQATRRAYFHVAFLGALLALCTSAGEWHEPKNGLFTEEQLVQSVGATKDYMQYLKAAGKAMEGSKSGFGALAVLGDVDKKMQAILDKHGLQKKEHEWLATQVTNCVGALFIEENLDKMSADLTEQKKKNAIDQATAAAKVKTYQAALKSNTRVLTAEQRADLVKQAKDQQTAAEEEAKTHADEAKAAADEAAKAEAGAKDLEALAKKPPADVEADAKADYIKGKIEEAAALRATIKEISDREKEAKKLEAESRAKADGFARQGAHPEIPVTAEDLEQVKKDNKQGLDDATAEVETVTQAGGILKDAEANLVAQRATLLKDVKPENMVLARKHQDEIKTAMGFKN